MKTLSLMQPWATLVAIGAKKIETRSWPTAHRGPLAIHASARFLRAARDLCLDPYFRNALERAGLIEFGRPTLPIGAVVAVVRVVDCVRITADNKPEWPELAFGDYTPGRWMWLLEDVQRLPEPVPAKGALGLWEWDELEVKIPPSPQIPLPLGEGERALCAGES